MSILIATETGPTESAKEFNGARLFFQLISVLRDGTALFRHSGLQHSGLKLERGTGKHHGIRCVNARNPLKQVATCNAKPDQDTLDICRLGDEGGIR
jgi:hypothetical protein